MKKNENEKTEYIAPVTKEYEVSCMAILQESGGGTSDGIDGGDR